MPRKQKGDGLGVYGLDSTSPAAIYMDLMCAGAFDNLPEPNYLHSTGLSALAHYEWGDPRVTPGKLRAMMMHLYGVVRFGTFDGKDTLLLRMSQAIEAHA
jgi:hypothetical protein